MAAELDFSPRVKNTESDIKVTRKIFGSKRYGVTKDWINITSSGGS
jgi:hypothetical protein